VTGKARATSADAAPMRSPSARSRDAHSESPDVTNVGGVFTAYGIPERKQSGQ
jgi:hypothetical protein